MAYAYGTSIYTCTYPEINLESDHEHGKPLFEGARGAAGEKTSG
jgi:hypothetical protein